MEQLSPHATTTEPACCNYWSPCAQSPCSTTREATAMRSLCTATKSSPCSPQLEKAHAQQRTPNTAKKEKKKKKQRNSKIVNHNSSFQAPVLPHPQLSCRLGERFEEGRILKRRMQRKSNTHPLKLWVHSSQDQTSPVPDRKNVKKLNSTHLWK